ncbi:DUF2705 family protein [Peribacillus frigoritolerans]|uniref:DUF2705 family protein n=1 Tax=Peribacillus castrilensis TaxID=2897690 RepID=UPI002DC403B2|nr:DUF2705 family protein [Peribacillus castrilensis]
MNRHYRLIIFVFFTILLQAFFMRDFSDFQLQYPFLLGVPLTSNSQLNYQFLIYWYLPIVALTFYFSGFINDVLEKKGVLEIIRNHNLKKWILKRLFFMSSFLLVFIVFQTLVFLIFFPNNQLISFEQLVLWINYYLMLLILIGIQLVLELIFSSKIALLCINIYIVGSLLLTQEIYDNSWSNLYFVAYLTVPNYGMGFKTGYNIIHFYTEIINRHVTLPVLITVNLLILLFVLKRMKKIDILP